MLEAGNGGRVGDALLGRDGETMVRFGDSNERDIEGSVAVVPRVSAGERIRAETEKTSAGLLGVCENQAIAIISVVLPPIAAKFVE